MTARYTIKITKDWPIKGGVISKGAYKVPEQISQGQAEKAMREGYADKALPGMTTKRRTTRKKRAASGS